MGDGTQGLQGNVLNGLSALHLLDHPLDGLKLLVKQQIEGLGVAEGLLDQLVVVRTNCVELDVYKRQGLV